ncbi:MAG TPA: host attachment protein [Croceicoccus sp.]|nr:host attachment protein [Croceicoccus sp.]
MILRTGTVILVTDGARMLLLRNVGSATHPNLKVLDHRQCDSLPNREIAADAPGISVSSVGAKRHSYDEGDPHGDQEARFVTAAAEALDAAIGNDAAPVVVAAAPSALRVLRRAYSPRVRKALAVELDRDFTHLSVEDIAVRLASI